MHIIPSWLTHYQSNNLFSDIIAGLIVGILVIPQSLGYAVLAGLPPVYGLYSSIIPVLVYAWIGANSVQAVGSVAIMAIMTASTLHPYAEQGLDTYISMASLLAVMVGAMLLLAGKLRLGWLMQFVSRGVNSGFISSAGVLIFISQIKYLTNIDFSGSTAVTMLNSLYHNVSNMHTLTMIIGGSSFALLLINRYGNIWQKLCKQSTAVHVERLFPLLLMIVLIIASDHYAWQQQGVAVIGSIPQGLPSFVMPYIPNIAQIINLLPSAGLMALIAFVSSCSVGSFYSRQRNEVFDFNSELRGLGWANICGGFFQSFTITSGFSRTAINNDAGAKTLLASVITALVMVATLLYLSNILAPLPYALLGAIIMSSVIKLIDVSTFRSAYRVDKTDAMNMAVTFITALIFGLNTGLLIGLLLSFASLIWKSSKPHIAIVGVLAETEHFRNIERHTVQTFDNLLIIRIDERLFFGNSMAIQQRILSCIEQYSQAQHIVLMMSGVNHIDLTAQEMLVNLNESIKLQNKTLHYSEVKGFVMDILADTPVIQDISGHVFLSTIQAVDELK